MYNINTRYARNISIYCIYFLIFVRRGMQASLLHLNGEVTNIKESTYKLVPHQQPYLLYFSEGLCNLTHIRLFITLSLHIILCTSFELMRSGVSHVFNNYCLSRIRTGGMEPRRKQKRNKILHNVM
jgi:hypothetical protein